MGARASYHPSSIVFSCCSSQAAILTWHQTKVTKPRELLRTCQTKLNIFTCAHNYPKESKKKATTNVWLIQAQARRGFKIFATETLQLLESDQIQSQVPTIIHSHPKKMTLYQSVSYLDWQHRLSHKIPIFSSLKSIQLYSHVLSTNHAHVS